MKTYIVEVPFRGTEFHEIEANSKAEALRLIDEVGEGIFIDWRADIRYLARNARLISEASP